MSSFKSKESRRSAIRSVNKLVERYLPSVGSVEDAGRDDSVEKYAEVIGSTTKKGKSGALKIAQIRREASHLGRNSIEKRRAKRRLRRQKQSMLRKEAELEKKVTRLGKLAIGDSDEVQKVIKRNLGNLESWEPHDSEEIAQKQREILELTSRDIRDRKRVDAKQKSFDYKVKKGIISVPGLTPGLAPVGASDSEEDESGDDMTGFKDDFDDFH